MPDRRKNNTWSAENGRQSHGPVTQEGKQRSSLNAYVHGAVAKRLILLPMENGEEFQRVLVSRHELFDPKNETESAIVYEYAFNEWRLNRTLRWERRAIEDADATAKLQNRKPEHLRMEMFASKGFSNLQTYRSRILMDMMRNVKLIALLRKEFGAVPDAMFGLDLAPGVVYENISSRRPEKPAEPQPPTESPKPQPAEAPEKQPEAPAPVAETPAIPQDAPTRQPENQEEVVRTPPGDVPKAA